MVDDRIIMEGWAMISVLGIFAAEMVSGKDAIQQFGF